MIMNETKEKLKIMLYDILNDKDFVIGVISPLDNESEMKQVIKFIEKNRDTITSSELLMLSLSIDKDRGKDYIVELNLSDKVIKRKKSTSQ